MTDKRLRVLHVVVQPLLVWDDGEELTPGPPLDPMSLPVSKLAEFAESLPAQVERLAEGLAQQER